MKDMCVITTKDTHTVETNDIRL